MADEEPADAGPADAGPVDPTPDAPSTPEPGTPEPTAPSLRSEEALARSKDEVTPRFKEPKGPKKPSRWAPGRKLGSRPFQ